MKKELYTLVAFFVISLPSFSQGSFFWTRNHKVMLTADSSQILVKAKEKAEITGLMDNIKQSDPEADVTQLSIGGESFVLVKKHGVNKNVQRIEYQHSDFQIPVFHGEDYIPYYFNGDIIFRPKQGINLEQISQIVNNGIYLKGSVSNKTYFFRVGKGENVLDVSNKIHESGLVEWCHPDFMAQIERYQEPTDPMFQEQYYLRNTGQLGGTSGIDINVIGAWGISTGCDIRIAVIDDGVEDHEDLDGRVLEGFTVLDQAGFGRPNDVCFLVDPINNVFERVAHGMACTGIIAASHNNLGVAGIAPNSLIYPVNIFVGGETTAQLVTSINRAWNPNFGNADIISNSWGSEILQ